MEKEEENNLNSKITSKQEQIHDILFSREISWQEIIYDLINTEQLDPWDIDIGILTNKYLERIRSLEDEDFFVSSKVLLAAAFLLRIKSELLLDKYLKSIDEILFGKKEEKIQKINLDELDFEDIPDLVPKSPLPRFKKVSLKELIESLNKAIITENRRIKKEIINNNALRETSISLPKRRFNPTTKSKEIYEKLLDYIKQNFAEKISFSELTSADKEERIISFSMLLNLENQRKVWLEQLGHFEEFYIWPRNLYFKKNPNFFADLIKEYGEALDEETKKDENIEDPDIFEAEIIESENSDNNHF
jgi:chromatin segregation and condensation protein Rec8/ScpA/Scc1 (kleisin family)